VSLASCDARRKVGASERSESKQIFHDGRAAAKNFRRSFFARRAATFPDEFRSRRGVHERA
jgi:hypothetical protein